MINVKGLNFNMKINLGNTATYHMLKFMKFQYTYLHKKREEKKTHVYIIFLKNLYPRNYYPYENNLPI